MPSNVFRNNSCSDDSGNKIDTSIFVQTPYLRSNCMEVRIEEDIDSKNQYRIKKLPDPISIREAATKVMLIYNFNAPNIIKTTDHVEFDDNYLDNVRFIKVHPFPTLEEHLTPKIYVDQAISDGVDESSFLRLDPDEKVIVVEQDSIVHIFTLTLPKTKIELLTKSYVDSRLNDPSIIRNNTEVDLIDKNPYNVEFIKIDSMPVVAEHLTAKNYADKAFL